MLCGADGVGAGAPGQSPLAVVEAAVPIRFGHAHFALRIAAGQPDAHAFLAFADETGRDGLRWPVPGAGPSATVLEAPTVVVPKARYAATPVSTMSQWCVSRPSLLARKAVVIFGSANTVGHSANARLVVTMIDVRSYSRLIRWNSS